MTNHILLLLLCDLNNFLVTTCKRVSAPLGCMYEAYIRDRYIALTFTISDAMVAIDWSYRTRMNPAASVVVLLIP